MPSNYWLKLYHEVLDIRGAIVYDEGARTSISQSNMCVEPWPLRCLF